MKKKNINLGVSVLFVLILFFFTAMFVIIPDSEFSDEENRALTTFPEFSFEALADGTFSSQINEYFADQFPLRDTLVGLKGLAETALGKGENNGVLLGDDDQLAVRLYDIYLSRLEQAEDMDYYSEENLALSLEALNSFAENLSIPLLTVLPPRTVDVAESAFDYPTEISDKIYTQINSTLSENTGYIDMLPMFREKYENGEYVYYRTDHHWTTYGAYLAYCEIMKAWGMEDEILPESAFTVEKVEDFRGTSWSRAGLKFVSPDTLEIWTVGDEENYNTSCVSTKNVKGEDGKLVHARESYKKFSGFINRDYLTQKDKYAAFLDGTHNEQIITLADNSGTQRETLLILKDSFANTLIPFLAHHFDILVENLAAKNCSASEYLEEFGCDRVLIVYNWENLITNVNLASVK